MSSFNPFDTNQYRVAEFPDLGAEISFLVEDARAQAPNSRARAIAALAAVRHFIADCGDGSLELQTSAALCELAKDLYKVEYALRDLEEGLPPDELVTQRRAPGRPPEPRAVVEFQARVVVAVEWLQILKPEPLTRNSAETIVAPLIPMALCREHPGPGNIGCLTQLEQLRAWQDAFRRAGTRKAGVKQETWWELEKNSAGHNLEDAKPERVLRWVRAALSKQRET